MGKETQHGEARRTRRIGGGGEGCGVGQRQRRDCGAGQEGRAEGERGNIGESVTDFLLILLFSDASFGLVSSEGGVGEFGSFFVRAEGMVEGREGTERDEGVGVGAAGGVGEEALGRTERGGGRETGGERCNEERWHREY